MSLDSGFELSSRLTNKTALSNGLIPKTSCRKINTVN